jgi:hypothetical protein
MYAVTVPELGRLELQVGTAAGYEIVNGERRPLPAGSSLEKGVFRWQLGPGFLGSYDLEFVGRERIGVRVAIGHQEQAAGTLQ